MKSLILRHPPRWRSIPRKGWLDPGIAPVAASWILEKGSLTQRLKLSFEGPIRVRILFQGPHFASAEEARVLGVRAGTRLTLREVVLLSDTTPLILARSLLPRATLQRADRRLWRLGNQPLGEILFSHASLARQTLEYTRTPLNDPLGSPLPPTWGRRSLYTLGARAPLLIAEFFLPACLQTVHPEI